MNLKAIFQVGRSQLAPRAERIQQRVAQFTAPVDRAMRFKNDTERARGQLDALMDANVGIVGVQQTDRFQQNTAFRLIAALRSGGDTNTKFIVTVRDDHWISIDSTEVYVSATPPAGREDAFISVREFAQVVLDTLHANGLHPEVYGASEVRVVGQSRDARPLFQTDGYQ